MMKHILIIFNYPRFHYFSCLNKSYEDEILKIICLLTFKTLADLMLSIWPCFREVKLYFRPSNLFVRENSPLPADSYSFNMASNFKSF
jgi:hypothetical protein